MTFERLVRKADRLDTRHGSFGARILDVLDNARINADDTVYLEKSTLDWNAVAIASLETILSYSEDKRVNAWFHRNGVTW